MVHQLDQTGCSPGVLPWTGPCVGGKHRASKKLLLAYMRFITFGWTSLTSQFLLAMLNIGCYDDIHRNPKNIGLFLYTTAVLVECVHGAVLIYTRRFWILGVYRSGCALYLYP